MSNQIYEVIFYSFFHFIIFRQLWRFYSPLNISVTSAPHEEVDPDTNTAAAAATAEEGDDDAQGNPKTHYTL